MTRYGRQIATSFRKKSDNVLSPEQFQQLLERLPGLAPTQRGSFMTCTYSFDGVKNAEVVEAFLTAVNVFKRSCDISDKTDASSYAFGAVLMQGEGESEHPVEYASRLLTQVEREALAVVWAITKFRGYIWYCCLTRRDVFVDRGGDSVTSFL
jgi:hypothetical protein